MLGENNEPTIEVEPAEALATEEMATTPEPTIESPPANRKAPSLEAAPIPDNLTEQQKLRDVETTVLYRQFVEAHRDKRDFAKRAKRTIHRWCIAMVSLLIVACVGLSAYVLIKTDRQPSDIVALISAIIPLIIAVIGTLNIVTKYVFPEDEERNITEIVKQIHENDLKNKQENMRTKE